LGNDLVPVAALRIDGNGNKHPLGLVGEATENAAVVQALIDNLTERGLDPTVCRLFIIDGRQGAEQSHSPHLRRPHPDPAPLVSISTYLVLITVLFAAKITFARFARAGLGGCSQFFIHSRRCFR
jgi:hypothetical protein